MNGITLWYAKLSHKARVGLLCGVIGLALLVVIMVAYMILVPEKVQVRTGTIVRDPIDGHVWEDNTQTLMVNPSEVSNYHVVYEDRLSDEHQKELDAQKEQAAVERQKLEQATGVQAMQTVVPTQQMQDLQTTQKNMSVMSQEVVTGMDFANEIDQTRTALKQFRNQVANTPLPAEVEPLRQNGLAIIDEAIQACTLTLEYIGTGNDAILQQATNLAQKAADDWQKLVSQYAVPTQ